MSGVDDATRAELSALLDGALPAERAAALRRRMQGDEALRREYDSLRRTVEAVRNLERVLAPAELRERLAAAVKTHRPAARIYRWIPAVAAAAAVVVAALLILPRDDETTGWPEEARAGKQRTKVEPKDQPAPESTSESEFRQRARPPVDALAKQAAEKSDAAEATPSRKAVLRDNEARPEAPRDLDKTAEADAARATAGGKEHFEHADEEEPAGEGGAGGREAPRRDRSAGKRERKSTLDADDGNEIGILTEVERGAPLETPQRLEAYLAALDAAGTKRLVQHIESFGVAVPSAPKLAERAGGGGVAGAKLAPAGAVEFAGKQEALSIGRLLRRVYPVREPEHEKKAKARARARRGFVSTVGNKTRGTFMVELEGSAEQRRRILTWLQRLSTARRAQRGGNSARANSSGAIRGKDATPKRFRVYLSYPKKPPDPKAGK